MAPSIGFIGAGQMAQAIAGGMVAAGRVNGADIACADPSSAAVEQFQGAVHGATRVADNQTLVAQCPTVFLAVKPQMLPRVIEDLQPPVPSETLFVSVMAGISLTRLSQELGTPRIIRVMPNTPALIRQGACGVARNAAVAADEFQQVMDALSAIGLCREVPEPLLDVVTGLSGSGPAYVFLMLEALIDGGVRQGLPRETACELAIETVRGAAALVAETGEHPAVLRDRVTSPGGTTAAGLYALESAGTRAALQAAVAAATERARELGG